MAILQLSSTNPKFSFIIRKNPASGMTIKSLRKGKTFAWFKDENTYNVYFKDADNEISYQVEKDEQFEYLNTTRYSSPIFPLNAITDYFSSATKEKSDDDVEGYENTLYIDLVQVEWERYLEYFSNHFEQFNLQYEEVAYKNYKIKISTKKSVHELLHYANALFLFLTIISKEYLHVAEEAIEKYIKSMNIIEAPYYIRYLFSKNVLTGKSKFFRYKNSLEKSQNQKIELSFGGTDVQRKEWITDQLDFSKSIVDIGCGEGAYALPYAKKIGENSYYAIDIDDDVREKLRFKVERKELENVSIYESFEHLLETYEKEEISDVLLTEVVEHMEIREATKLIQEILQHVSFDQFIITTPNKDFNEFYTLTEMRHPDHVWEMTSEEFRNWIKEVLKDTPFVYSYSGIGDSVNGISTTQGVIIRRKDEK